MALFFWTKDKLTYLNLFIPNWGFKAHTQSMFVKLCPSGSNKNFLLNFRSQQSQIHNLSKSGACQSKQSSYINIILDNPLIKQTLNVMMELINQS